MSDLAKDMARYEVFRANSFGNTDASRSLHGLSSPSGKLDSAAVQEVVLQSLANENYITDYSKLINSFTDPAHWCAERSAITRNSIFNSDTYQLDVRTLVILNKQAAC